MTSLASFIRKTKKNNYAMLIVIILIMMVGIYKNIIWLNILDYGSISYNLKIILYIIILLGIGILFTKLFKQKEYLWFSFLIIMFSPVNVFFPIIIVTLVLYLIAKYIKKYMSVPLLIISILIIVTKILNISFLNPLEASGNYVYNILNSFLGFSEGGIFQSSIVLLLISIIFLKENDNFKIDISINSILVFMLCAIVYGIAFNLNYFNIILNSYFISTAVFLGSDSLYSPFTKIGKIIYALLFAIFSFLFEVVLNISGSSILVLLIIQFMSNFIDFIVQSFQFHKIKQV